MQAEGLARLMELRRKAQLKTGVEKAEVQRDSQVEPQQQEANNDLEETSRFLEKAVEDSKASSQARAELPLDLSRKSKICMNCRGKGLPGGCPECGKDTLTAAEKVAEISVEVLNNLAIPQQYRSVEWDIEKIKATHSEEVDNKDFKKYYAMLTKCIDGLKSGKLPEKSVLIVAGRGYAKRTFAYCCMKEAIKHGFTTCNLIDTTEYRRLNILSAERPFIKQVSDSPNSVEELHNCDILFVSVDYLSYMNSLKVIEAICDKRSRKGKPTIILSRYTPSEMATFGYDRDPMSFINRGYDSDSCKYPYLIWYRGEYKEI